MMRDSSERSAETFQMLYVAEYAPDFATRTQLHRLEVPIPASHAAQSDNDDEQKSKTGGQESSASGTLRVMSQIALIAGDFPKVCPTFAERSSLLTIQGRGWITENAGAD